MIPLTHGDHAQASLIVAEPDTAGAIALDAQDAFPAVFATSRMIALMEIAAARVIRPCLQPQQLSVGVAVNVRHTAATAAGGTVTAIATFLRAEGKLLYFKVEAFDDSGSIGEGEHTRAIVDTERLVSGAQRRLKEMQ